MAEPATAATAAAAAAAAPAFSPATTTVVFVLGGPGAGKGTQCARLVARFGFVHLSAGDLLRAEQARAGSRFGELIGRCITDGQIVPMEVTVQLLETAMRAAGAGGPTRPRFLIDGFPRKMDQAARFEVAVCPACLVIFYDCPVAELERRLLQRGKTSGRADDNADSVGKRFKTFVDTSMPVIQYYGQAGKLIRVDSSPAPDAVFEDTIARLQAALGEALTETGPAGTGTAHTVE